MEEESQTMYTLIVQPGKTELVEFADDCSLGINNICISDVPDDAKPTPNRVIAHIMTIDPYIETEDIDVKNIPVNDLLLASFIPGENEYAQTNYVFSPLNIIKIENTGEYPVHIAGYQTQIEDDDEEEDEEEEAEENSGDSPDEDGEDAEEDEEDPIDIQKKLLALSKQVPAKPANKVVEAKVVSKPPPQQKSNPPQRQQQNQQQRGQQPQKLQKGQQPPRHQHQQPNQKKSFGNQQQQHKHKGGRQDFPKRFR